MPTITTAARNAACDAIVGLIDGGTGAGDLVFRTSGDVEVATCPFSATAFGNSATGTATAASITDDSSATGGTVSKATADDGDATEVIEFTVATSGQDIDISSTTVAASDTVSVSSLTVTMPAS